MIFFNRQLFSCESVEHVPFYEAQCHESWWIAIFTDLGIDRNIAGVSMRGAAECAKSGFLFDRAPRCAFSSFSSFGILLNSCIFWNSRRGNLGTVKFWAFSLPPCALESPYRWNWFQPETSRGTEVAEVPLRFAGLPMVDPRFPVVQLQSLGM